MENRKSIRSQAKRKRDALTPEERIIKSGTICNKIIKSNEFLMENNILVYHAFGSEVLLDVLLDVSHQNNKYLYFPKVNKENRSMEFYQVDNLDGLVEGAYGIMEPRAVEAKRFTAQEGLIVVPGVAFDLELYRLGYGAGYYDRYLERFPKLLKMMVSYDCQQVESTFPLETDVKMDFVITETKLL